MINFNYFLLTFNQSYSIIMKMKILILTDREATSCRGIYEVDMAIVMHTPNKFSIVKHRYGELHNNLPIELLSKVILNPEGNLFVEWI